ncbi:hypothetical protein [Alkalicoccus saliphilus]|uniref:Ankyrin repeat domain-containing protein n=1 Tax=Alkalicoccus saliphilus TaxID=200989 RepID=A0A2T4U207_9BACI|nr:hypothetical protein [Alkalicoccus saliphilus]PTL37428.1 hypothetical protein C6Y45_16505 [Alkalicoccus saliphilus]
MELCGKIQEDGTKCTNAAGAKTKHVGFGYCYEHDHTPEAEAQREKIKKLLEQHDAAELEELLVSEEAHPDISVGGFPTVLLYAIYLEDAPAVDVLLRHGADQRIIRRRDYSQNDIIRLVQQGKSGKLLEYADLTEEETEFFNASSSHRALMWWQQYGMRMALGGAAVLIISYVTGLWEQIGTLLTIAGAAWGVYLFVMKKKYTVLPDYRGPVWVFIAGGFFILFSGAWEGMQDALYTAVFLLLLGNTVLWINSIIRKDDSRRKRGIITGILFVLTVFLI